MSSNVSARSTPPVQNELVRHCQSAFSPDNGVSRLMLRGSLAAGTADAMSDIDLVVGVRDSLYECFIKGLDDVFRDEFASIFPGWRDLYVQNMGAGLGFVYLVERNMRLYHIDLYAVPTSKLREFPGSVATVDLCAADSGETGSGGVDVQPFITSELSRKPTPRELVIETLVLTSFLQKRIARRRPFVVYSDTFLLFSAVKEFLRTSLAPRSPHWGWYHLEEDIGQCSAGRECLKTLMRLVQSPPIRCHDDLLTVFDEAVGIFSNVSATLVQRMARELAVFRHCLEMS